jgi:hypothetical protein
MQWINFTIFIANFEIVILAHEFIHMPLFIKAIVANRELIEDMNLLVFILDKFELFQICHLISQTFMEVLLWHELRDPSNHSSKEDSSFHLYFYRL